MDIFEAIESRDAVALAKVLASGADLEVRNESGDTPLICAAGQGACEIVDVLLEAGADINFTNDFGFDALRSALWESHLSLAEHLVSRGATVDIDCAAALGYLPPLHEKWPQPPPLNEAIGTFLGACRCGQTEVVKWFLDQGIPVNLHPPGEEWGGIGCSGLHHAACNGHAELVQLLLDQGADPNQADDVHGSQALAWAAGAGHEEVVDILLDSGAPLNHQNTHGLTAADLAKREGFAELALRLNTTK